MLMMREKEDKGTPRAAEDLVTAIIETALSRCQSRERMVH
jgi:hypothetical protein